MRISDWSSDVCSSDLFLAKFKAEAVGHFASGWAWLVLKDGKLDITSLHDGDTPVAYDGMKPLLTLDVWEHAYYIDYRNARPDYVETVLKNAINWEFVAQHLDGEGVSRADQQGRTCRLFRSRAAARSEERIVGKEGGCTSRSWWEP